MNNYSTLIRVILTVLTTGALCWYHCGFYAALFVVGCVATETLAVISYRRTARLRAEAEECRQAELRREFIARSR